MQLRIVEGPGAPWAGVVQVDDGAVWVGEEPYCPLDDLRGFVVEEADRHETEALAAVGFRLAWLH